MKSTIHVLIALICGVLLGLFWPQSDKPVDANMATTAPEVRKIEKEEIKPENLKVYKPEAKDKLPLPEKIKDDKDEHVIAASQIKADGHDHTVVTVINATTGESTTIDHRKPLPWLAFEKKSEVRLDYGLKGYIIPVSVARLSYRSDLIRIKGLVLGLNTSLDFDGEYFLGGGIGYRW